MSEFCGGKTKIKGQSTGKLEDLTARRLSVGDRSNDRQYI